MTGFARELDEAARLARAAGAVLMKVYATDFAVSYKGPNDPVTDADKQANELLVAGLQAAFPADGVVAEESVDNSDALRQGRVWYVDPLDGTSDFVLKNGEFSVMIGLAVNGGARAGVVYRPVGDVLFAGITDREAWVEEAGRRTPLAVSNQANLSSLRLVVSRSHRHALIDDLKTRLGIGRELRHGSVGLKVGLIATQQADLYVDLSEFTKAWDSCGPEAILRGAGGRMTDLAGQPLIYGGPDLHNRKGLVASNGACHDRVIAALAPLARKAGRI
ncbi:MAG: 3'(2'),5'-bisphosphate nucleotidase CysQ [Nitrospirae bacterium]|nr:MAG: 3'(2'),5'-bisphosphate nucleotidase CysQ [Nitrospirota bacterium]